MTRRSSTKSAEVIARGLGRLSKASLVRSGANDVYTVDDLVLRLAPPGTDIDHQAKAAELLARHGIAIPRLIASGIMVEQPFTAWERVRPDPSAAVDFSRLGAEIGRLHHIDPAAVAQDMSLPWCDEATWLDLDASLDAAEAANVVPPGDIETLRGCWDRCRAAGGPMVCHGDVHPQNAIMRDGQPIIIDWDTICLGPPQWDHAALLTWSTRWGGEPGAYSDFAAGYGTSFAHDQLANDLARLRLLAPTINLIARAANRRAPRHRSTNSIKYWRGDAAAPAWTPQ